MRLEINTFPLRNKKRVTMQDWLGRIAQQSPKVKKATWESPSWPLSERNFPRDLSELN